MRIIFASCAAILLSAGMAFTPSVGSAQTAGQAVAPQVAPTVSNMHGDAIRRNSTREMEKKKEGQQKSQADKAKGDRQSSGVTGTSGSK